MTHIEKLDFVLKILYNQNELISSKDLFKKVNGKIIEHDLRKVINHLSDLNYIKKTVIENPNNSKVKPPFICEITYLGFLFFDQGGFHKENKTVKLNHNWKRAKTIANTLNAIIILAIAILGIIVSIESNKKDDIIKEYKSEINNLKTELNNESLKKADSINLNMN